MARRKEFGSSWWAERWISVLESFGWDNRLQRGRSYARAGRVLEIEIRKGEVRAAVQGSRPRPYKVTISFATLKDAEWKRVIKEMADQALFAARLLAGEMPENIEEAFGASRVSLLPASRKDIITECSCPDWANPCKHIAAVCYLLGEEFDRDPFLLFRIRGKTREEIMEALRQERAAKAQSAAESDAYESEGHPASKVPADAEPSLWVRELMSPEPRPIDPSPEKFWRMDESKLAGFTVSIPPAPVSLGLLRRLGEPAFSSKDSDGADTRESIKLRPRHGKGKSDSGSDSEERSMTSSLLRYYEAVSRRAVEIAYGSGRPEMPSSTST